jgi:chromosome partitioning protein
VVTYDPGSRGSTSYVEAARELAHRGVALPPLPSRPNPGSPVAAPVGSATTVMALPDTDAATVPVPPSSEENKA